MKFSIWDILAVLTLVAVVIVGVIFLQIFSNPHTALNPFPPPTLPAAVVIPSSTPTQRSLPATWTPAPSEGTLQPGEVSFVATSTPLPTATGFMLPTFTPSMTFTVTPTITPTRTRDQAKYVSQNPSDGTSFSPSQDFDMTWKLKNVGINTWNTSYRFRYVSGEETYKKKNGPSISLPYPVGIDDTVSLTVDMRAPKEKGEYRTTWELVNSEGEKVFSVFFDFKVK